MHNQKRLKSLENTRFYEYDKSTVCLSRQYTERILKRPKNKGIEDVRLEIYTFFTPLETRKPKRKTIPIEEAGDLKVSCFYNFLLAILLKKVYTIFNKKEMHMNRLNYTELVLQRLEYYNDGAVFGMSDFADITDSKTLHMILKRLTEEGKVAKVLRGVYMKPRYSKLLGENIPPRIADIAEALAQRYGWNIVPTGATVLNMLGLSTQVPANYEFLSDGPYKTYEYDGTTIVFKHTNKNTELTQVSKKSALIIQALKAIGKEEIDNGVIRKIADFLSKEEKETMLQETKHCTSWVYEKIKMICKEAFNG